MPSSEGLSEAKRAVLEQYLNGELPRGCHTHTYFNGRGKP